MYAHEHCWEVVQAKAQSLLEAFVEAAGITSGKMNNVGDVLPVVMAAQDLLADALAALDEPDRTDWLKEIIADLPREVTEIRAHVEAHPADCPRCAKRQQERANIQ